MRRISWLLLGVAATAAGFGCSTISETLVGGGGTGTTTTSSSTTDTGSTTTTPGGVACTDYKQCTANATECQQPTCKDGFCGVEYTAAGTQSTQQTTGDCQRRVCDGQGNPTTEADDGDTPDDGNECTIDACKAGVAVYTSKPAGTDCSQNGGKHCTASGACVECLSSSDCTSGVCTANQCAPSACTDKVKNGDESDTDCGGSCPACPAGKQCGGGADCVSGSCTGGTCQATCSDGAKNGAETDVDCGGSTCSPCDSGKACAAHADCATGRCTNGQCADVLVISQLQTRGDAGGNDEFVELYNPTSVPVVFDSTWTIKARSAVVTTSTPCTSLPLATRVTGAAQVIPPHGHILFTNSTVPAYNGTIPGDGTYKTGIPDAGNVVLLHGNDIIDALCFHYNQATIDTLTTCSSAYICEGASVKNPHDNTTSATSNIDNSLERLPGGSSGNTQDTNDSAADFAISTTVTPHNLTTPPVP